MSVDGGKAEISGGDRERVSKIDEKLFNESISRQTFTKSALYSHSRASLTSSNYS